MMGKPKRPVERFNDCRDVILISSPQKMLKVLSMASTSGDHLASAWSGQNTNPIGANRSYVEALESPRTKVLFSTGARPMGVPV